MSNSTIDRKTPKAAPASKSAKVSTLRVEPFTVTEKWERIHVTIQRKDLDYLVERNQDHRRIVGGDVWMYVCKMFGGEDVRNSKDHAAVADPVLIAVEMDERQWSEVVKACTDAGADPASAIRWAIAVRCAQIRRFLKGKR